MKKYLTVFIVVLSLSILAMLVVENYSYIFSKRVHGRILNVARVPLNIAMIQTSGGTIPPQSFSFAISIRQEDGEIFTSSAEDRQWAVVQEGQCAEALLFPYPPWQLMKAGTYANARLERLFECPQSPPQH